MSDQVRRGYFFHIRLDLKRAYDTLGNGETKIVRNSFEEFVRGWYGSCRKMKKTS